MIGLQKLIDAALIVNPEAMYKILEESDEDAQVLAKKIKAVLSWDNKPRKILNATNNINYNII